MIEQVAVTGSTNADILERAREGAPEGLWIRADRQDGGRGRLGRSWDSPTGNFYGSTLVKLRAGDPPAHTLSLVAAIATADALRHFVPKADLLIKWPNDLLLGEDKLAGILLERQGDNIVVGIGVNLAYAPQLPDRVAAALSAAGPAPAPQIFCEVLARQFEAALARWRGAGTHYQSGLAATIALWLKQAHPVGAAIATSGPDGTKISGTFAGLTPDAMLNLRLPDGETVVIHSGDIELQRGPSDAAGD